MSTKPLPGFPNPIVDIIGKIWTLPNTLVGILYGILGHILGWLQGTNPTISVGNNAIQFQNNPITQNGAAFTLGNTVHYSEQSYPDKMGAYGNPDVNVGLHEAAHTYQYQVLGILFLPVYLILGGANKNNRLEQAAQRYATHEGSWWPW
ncbi:MAG: hypothetical protein AAF669_03030 [Pseudomonadota bacterium]